MRITKAYLLNGIEENRKYWQKAQLVLIDNPDDELALECRKGFVPTCMFTQFNPPLPGEIGRFKNYVFIHAKAVKTYRDMVRRVLVEEAGTEMDVKP